MRAVKTRSDLIPFAAAASVAAPRKPSSPAPGAVGETAQRGGGGQLLSPAHARAAGRGFYARHARCQLEIVCHARTSAQS